MSHFFNAAGFSAGEFGDLILNTTLCRTHKELYPDSHLTFCCNKKYAKILSLFYNNEYIDGFRIWHGYDDWPVNSDLEFISKIQKDGGLIYNAMPRHKDEQWFLKPGGHNITEVHDMHGFPEPKNKQCYLNKWFDNILPPDNKIVTVCAFPSGTHPNQLARTFNPIQFYKLFNEIEKLGYSVVRLDTKEVFELEDRWPASKLSIIEAAQLMTDSKLFLTTDSLWSWVADGYGMNTIGWARLPAYVPVNPNGYYFVNNTIQNIPIDSILSKIEEKLKQ